MKGRRDEKSDGMLGRCEDVRNGTISVFLITH